MVVKRIREWLRSDWKTIDSRNMFTCESHDGSTVVVSYYEIDVKEHRESGERKIVITESCGEQVEHGLSCTDVPRVLEVENGYGISQVTYSVEYVKDEFDVSSLSFA